MHREMMNLESQDVYKLVPRVSSMRTLKLGWVLRQEFKNGVFEKNKARLVTRDNHQRTVVNRFHLLCALNPFAPSSL